MRILILITIAIMNITSIFAQSTNTKFTTLNNEEFSKLIADKKVQLVDVRSTAEYDSGYIPNDINIDVQSSSFDNKISKLDKTLPVAVYCRSGARSKIAAKKLADAGFKVYELDKGILGWKGKKIESKKQ